MRIDNTLIELSSIYGSTRIDNNILSINNETMLIIGNDKIYQRSSHIDHDITIYGLFFKTHRQTENLEMLHSIIHNAYISND